MTVSFLNNATESLNKYLRALVAEIATELATPVSFISDHRKPTEFPLCVRIYSLAEDGYSSNRNLFCSTYQVSIFATGSNALRNCRAISRLLMLKLGLDLENSSFEAVVPQFDYEVSRTAPPALNEMCLVLSSREGWRDQNDEDPNVTHRLATFSLYYD